MDESLAIFFKRLRLDNQDERLVDMAKRLDVSQSFLSSIETGKRNLNDKLIEKIVQEYHLNSEEEKELIYLRDISAKKLNIAMDNLESDKKEAVVQFLSNVKDLDEKSLEKINMIIKRKKGDSE